MDVYELVESAGGEIVRGCARVRVGAEYIVVGRITPEGMVMTNAGKEMVDALQKTKKPRTKRKQGIDVSSPPPVDPENPADVQV